MLFVWGFGSTTQPSKKTYCQALLIFLAASLVLAGIVLFAVGGLAYFTAPHGQPPSLTP